MTARHHSLFMPDFKPEPFWWERTPRPEGTVPELPERADVVIIGSGYTGLSAAIQTARGGRHTVVIDAETAGWGCSSRNGGQISTSIKKSYDELAEAYGEKTGYEIAREGHNALQWISEFVAKEGIECDFQRPGRFYAAHSPAQFEFLARGLDKPVPKGLETDAYLVPKAEQHTEIGSDFYHGGIVQPNNCALDPARFHKGLLDLAVKAGVTVVSNCRATAVRRDGDGIELLTAKGQTRTRGLIVATSGYTGAITPWHRRRIIPIGSYMLATEPLGKELIDELIPKGRMVTDTRKLVVYYRTCPQRERILFGGRVAISETDPHVAAPALHGEMVRIFPQLRATRISHAWMGFVGYTFDAMPHIGVRDGIHYSMGYCGSGVSLSSYLGVRIGQKVLDLPEGNSPLENLPFQTRPFYNGKPWFLAPSLMYHRWRDALT